MSERPVCKLCNERPCAINYKTEEKIYYRKFCDSCLHLKKKGQLPRWFKEGYKKKAKCEACGFIPKYQEQLIILDLNDKFKTICLNCEGAVKVAKKLEIKRGDLKPDF